MTTAALGTFSSLNEELSRSEARASAAEGRAAGLQQEVSALTAQLQEVILERKRTVEQKPGLPSMLRSPWSASKSTPSRPNQRL